MDRGEPIDPIERGPRSWQTRKGPDDHRFEPAQVPGAHLARHQGLEPYLSGAVGDGRAVEVEAAPIPVLDDTEAPGLVELHHPSDQRDTSSRR